MMSFERKIALLLFSFWAGAVMLVFWITLQSTHRSLSELPGNQVLQRFIRLPHRLFEQSAAKVAVTSVESNMGSNKEAISDPGTVMISPIVEKGIAKDPLTLQSGIAPLFNTLKSIQVQQQQQQQQWVYQLDIDGDAPRYHHFALAKNLRWVLDLKGKWSIKGVKTYSQTSGPVTSIALGKHPDHLRVVFRLKKGTHSPQIKLEKGKLLVLFQ